MPLQSFCEELEDVKNESSTIFQQLYRSYKILQETVCFSTLLVIIAVHLIGMCGYGIAYFENCPMEPKIPLYLVVGGLTGLYKVLLLFFDESKMRHDDYHHKPLMNQSAPPSMLSKVNGRSVATSALHKILNIFLFVWFILGNYWILKHANFWRDQTATARQGDKYKAMLKLVSLCDIKIYTFALTHLVCCYILIAAVVLYGVIVLLVTRRLKTTCTCVWRE